MTKNYRLSLLVGVVIALSASGAHAATTFDLIDLGVLPGGVSSTATSVDNAGEVVGYTTFADNTTEAFYWTQAGGMVGLGGVNSKAFGVNNGNVAGVTGSQAFRWTSGTGIVLLDPTRVGEANGVNSSGKVVGNRTSTSTNHASVTWSSTNTLSNPFPTFNLTGEAINGLGQFVGLNSGISGYYNDGVGTTRVSLNRLLPTSLSDNRYATGAVSQVAAFEKIDTLTTISIGTLSGDLTSNALGINALGTAITGASAGHGGFIYDIATANLASLTSLLAPAQSGWSVLSGNAINDRGYIAAAATFGGAQHAVLLVPEPSTLVLAGLGLLGLFGSATLRRAGHTRMTTR